MPGGVLDDVETGRKRGECGEGGAEADAAEVVDFDHRVFVGCNVGDAGGGFVAELERVHRDCRGGVNGDIVLAGGKGGLQGTIGPSAGSGCQRRAVELREFGAGFQIKRHVDDGC